MYLRIEAICVPSTEWAQKKQVHDACIAADVPVPIEVKRFFGHEEPTKGPVMGLGVMNDSGDLETSHHLALSEEPDLTEMENGILIKVADLPKGTHTIRCVISQD